MTDEIACDDEVVRTVVAAEWDRWARVCEESAAARRAEIADHPFGTTGRWLAAARAEPADRLARRMRGS